MSNDAIETALALADQNWKFGRLASARDGYAAVLKEAPACWHAAFQLAWLEAMFEVPTAERIEQLRLPALPPELLKILDRDLGVMSQRTKRLSGRLEDWDIEALRAMSAAGDFSWWEARAADAADVGQPGLALACYSEAEKLCPEMYYDPPSLTAECPGRIDRHLAFLKDVGHHTATARR